MGKTYAPLLDQQLNDSQKEQLLTENMQAIQRDIAYSIRQRFDFEHTLDGAKSWIAIAKAFEMFDLAKEMERDLQH